MTVYVQSTAISDAIQEVWDRVLLEGAPTDTHQASIALWESLDLDVDDVRLLAIFGLSEMAKRAQRTQRSKGLPAIAVKMPDKLAWATHLASLTSVYDDAAGNPRPLLSFTQEDWSAFEVRMRALSKSYGERSGLAATARKMLVANGVNITSDLPADDLAVLARRADAVLTSDGHGPEA